MVISNKYMYIYYITSVTELTAEGAEAIVLIAFGAHFYKEISKGQLESAAKSFGLKLNLKKSDKQMFAIPLACALLNNSIIKLSKHADISNLCRSDIKKVRPF